MTSGIGHKRHVLPTFNTTVAVLNACDIVAWDKTVMPLSVVVFVKYSMKIKVMGNSCAKASITLQLWILAFIQQMTLSVPLM